MQFKESQPIYLQIAERLCDQILNAQLKADERLPSVRELAVTIEVNPNTVVRSYADLEQKELIYKLRGKGYFVAPEAQETLLQQRRDAFLQQTLPELFQQMQQLGVSIEQIQAQYAKQASSEPNPNEEET